MDNDVAPPRKPEWLRKKTSFSGTAGMKARLREKHLHTVCESARCPNMGECFSRGTATFLILGDQCTRTCSFCGVHKGPAGRPDPAEPDNVARMVKELGVRHAVITSVTRDDLPDGGAEHFALTVAAVRRENPGVAVELLTPDFGGDGPALETVLAARPDVFNHNMETVPRLYPAVRPQADFARSLKVLRRAAECDIITKSGLMAGLGETEAELTDAIREMKNAGVRILTLGQYLPPSRHHAPAVQYYEEGFYSRMADAANAIGIERVFAGPFVRSSYMAEKAGAL